ncbi:PP2C family protein-serine/threonine phosphatase [Intrasporangium sp. YIM S08009]|uniref:PP2C family protein-serine/threonine phosphatase n=1 Tax=Intrasporangium zincisolvens TaxID=3080018 RepID=UPI002B061EAD|nr:PP2C family protein-serine/threonine phosphatase [Intrasporangium sp. YIM S08009]
MDLRSIPTAPEAARTDLWRSPRAIGLASAALLVVTSLSDVAIDSRVAVLTVLLGLAPLLASSALTPRSTAGFAVAAVVVAAASGLWNDVDVQYCIRVADVVLVGALSVLVAVVRASREADLRDSRRIAGVAQEALLPVLPEQVGPVRLATRYHSATRTAQIGGDFFDFVADGGRLRLVLGDVSGKGIGAVTQAARVIRAFRQYGASEPDLLSAARRVHEYVTPFWDAERYATAVFVEITDAGSVTVVSAGHPAPLHVSGTVVRELPVHPCLPLGIGPADHVTTHPWNASDRLLLYTDGLVEARNRAGGFLPRASIEAALRQGNPNECLDQLLDRVRAHAGQFNDDLALLLLTNDSSATAVRVPDASTSRA